MTEDPPEDITQHAAYRASAEAATGWNGSHTVHRFEPLQADPCPPALWARLQALRDAAAARAANYRPA